MTKELRTDGEIRLIKILNQRRELIGNIGSGEVKASGGIIVANRIARMRDRVQGSIERIEKKLDVENLKTHYPETRRHFLEGRLTEEEFAPYREKVELLGLKNDDQLLEEYKLLGLKGVNLRLFAALAESGSRPLTARQLAEKIDYNRTEKHWETGEEYETPDSHSVKGRIRRMRKKVRPHGYDIAMAEATESQSRWGYFLIKHSPGE